MRANTERTDRIAAVLAHHGLDALVCTLGENVLMLTGYWPVVGTSVAVATRGGRVAVLVPEDEEDLATAGWAEVKTYRPGSLHDLIDPRDAAVEPLADLLAKMECHAGRFGYEDSSIYDSSSYAAMYRFQTTIRDLLTASAPRATVASGSDALTWLRTSLTPYEVGRVRLACRVAGEGFVQASGSLGPGLREPEVAAAFAAPMRIHALAQADVQRDEAFTWCMSGENSALAGAAFARTRNREMHDGDLVLVHCNSCIDGYWTDITRTYCLGQPDDRAQAMYDAVFAARQAALEAMRPGARAADVDGAARAVLDERGFGQYFTHGVGHNVGFSAISADFPPRLHPASPDTLDVGMTFNVEPSIYIEGFGGIRHCDVITLNEDGPEVLTGFQAEPEDLIIRR